MENCTIGWVEKDVSVRNLTYPETLEARAKQASERDVHAQRKFALLEPLAYAELFGRRFSPPENGIPAMRRGKRIMAVTHRWEMRAQARELAKMKALAPA